MPIDFSKLELKPNEIDVLLYHGDCIDGYACAFACYYYFKTKNIKRKISYIPCQYQKPPPMLNDKNVLICDFSYKFNTLKNIMKSAKKLAILDHHQSAEKDLKNIPDKYKIFTMEHSGAYIAWAYFFGEDVVPLMIRYIQDNDIWKKSLPNTRAFTSYIFNLPKTFDQYEKLLSDDYITSVVLPIGDGMQKQNDNYINEGVKKTVVNFMLIDNNLYFVGIINTSILKSEIGNAFLITNPDVNFAICYSKNEYTGENYLSLRSTNSGSDVEMIASKFGGGGHRNAAGLSVFSAETLPGILIDRYQCYNQIKHIKLIQQSVADNEDLILNIVYLNSYHHKRHLGKYLLQKRYEENFTGTPRIISEAISIMRNKLKDMTFYVGLDLAVIYYYSDSDDVTYFSITSDNLDLLHILKELYESSVVDTTDANISDRLKIKIKGLQNRLP
jgi:oligoribonuclease NrnB/cAMP/cGMP phosphodiesterase (DHH superfamily)